MLKGIFLTLLSAFSLNASANVIVDLYGTDDRTAEKIVNKYSPQVQAVESKLHLYTQTHEFTEKQLQEILIKREEIIQRIKSDGDFLYVNLNTVFYPNDPNQYTTIEVISKDDHSRLKLVTTNSNLPTSNRHDLIDKMREFTTLEMHLMANNQLDMSDLSCPVFHCVSGFHHPKLQPYLDIFNKGVVNDRDLILNTLNTDPDPERRAAAVFLVGHFNNPNEIISLLLPHLNDQNGVVRNNVIRVIGMTMMTAKIDKIDVRPFINLLSSPEETDRNKSLLVLLNAAENNSEKKIILQQGGERLIQLLKLKQPNNHETAYKILKRISGKDFGEHDIAAWQDWLSSQAKC